MVVECNQFIDDDNLTDKLSLIHLLDRYDADDYDEIPSLKHSPFHSEKRFTNLLLNTNYTLCILNINIANAFTKFDELEAFINRVNEGNPISVICLYLFKQIGKCIGLLLCYVIYVHEDFKCNELIINQMTRHV